jgi:Multicopper oxidase
VPLSVAAPQNADYVATYQSGYCTIAQWYSSACTSKPLFLDIPFAEHGEFVFHCHILEHEDGGMMAKIVVVSAPSATANDFNGDGKSDILWRNANGDIAIWLMNGFQALSTTGMGNVQATSTATARATFSGETRMAMLRFG